MYPLNNARFRNIVEFRDFSDLWGTAFLVYVGFNPI